MCGGTSCLPLFSFVLRSRRGSVWGVVLESQDTCRHLRYLFMISYFSQCLFFRSLYVLDARFFFPFLVRVPCRCLRHLLLSFLYCDIFVSFPTASRIRVSSRLFASFFFSTSWSSRKIDFRSIGVFATISKYSDSIFYSSVPEHTAHMQTLEIFESELFSSRNVCVE